MAKQYVGIKITPEAKSALEAIAEKNQISISAVIRWAIEEYIKKEAEQ